MNTNFPYDEERVAELLRTLPPAPEAWVKAAQELPQARRQMDEILAQFEADKEFRAAGYQLDPSLLPALRERLASV
jgi:hypothetical protein